MKFYPFQIEDLARGAIPDGLIAGLDTGLGKTLYAYTWAALKCGFTAVHKEGRKTMQVNGRVLMIVPGDLHEQTADEGEAFYGIRPTPIDCQQTFENLVIGKTDDGRPIIPPGFYITSYTQLTTNNVARMPDPEKWDGRALLDWLCLKVFADGHHADDEHSAESFFDGRGIIWADEYDLLRVTPEDTARTLDAAYRSLHAETQGWANEKAARQHRLKLDAAYQILKHLVCDTRAPRFPMLATWQQDWVIQQFCRRKIRSYQKHEGEFGEYDLETWECRIRSEMDDDELVDEFRPRYRIKCIYSPSLSDLSYDAFDCVTVDEGVKMKGTDTLVGRGVRQMSPRYRLVLTGTPIKNRLPDFFWLASWATGSRVNAHARWPYGDDPSEQQAFARTFLVSEVNLTQLEKGAKKSRYEKQRAEICNVHRLWKLLGPVVLRRRKDSTGEQIVKKIRRVVGVPMGTLQRGVYQYHLNAAYVDSNGMPAPAAKLQALRVAAAAPHSDLLDPQPGGARRDCCKATDIHRGICRACGHGEITARSSHFYTPKIVTVLTLVQEIMERGEQFVIGAAFHDPLDTLSRLLTEANVRHLTLDGRTSQKKRGKLSRDFKRGPESGIAGALCGVESMAEGHNWYRCPNIILMAYSWSADKFVQFINRIHRLNSPKDVNLYVVICDSSVDRVLESNINEKNDACELALDGKLIGEHTEELNLTQLLRIAESDFDPSRKTLNEEELYRDWPLLRERLRAASFKWGNATVPTLPHSNTPPLQPAAIAPSLQPTPDFNLADVVFDSAGSLLDSVTFTTVQDDEEESAQPAAVEPATIPWRKFKALELTL